MSNKNLQAPVRALKCLDILDDLTIRDLQPIQSEYPRKDCDRNDRNIQRNCYLKKLLQESSQETWQHLLQPNETNYDKIERVDRCKTVVDAKSYNNEQSLKYQNYSREDIKRILQPYLFDPLHVRGSVITVLPVHVYYDNFDIEKPVKEYRQRIKHSVPLEECKKVNRAQWISPEKIKTISKNLPAVKTPKKTFPNNLGSKSSKNHCLRTSNISPRDKKDADSCQTKKTCLKNQIIRKKTAAEIEEQSKQRIELNMNDAQRKLWANKYGKTIGKQLIDFIDNQTEVQTEPKPKYMMPTISSVESSKINNISKVENRNAKQRNEVQPDLKKLGHKNRIVQQDIDNTIHNIEHKMNYILKNSNDKGTNESFNSMEKEIADVLTIMKKTSPNSARKKLTSSPKVTTPKSLENMRGDLDLLSDELFKKLEYILDEVNTSSESKSSISSKMKNSAQEPLSDLNVKNNYKNQSQPNKDKCSKTKYCVSSFTAITETGINEGKNDLNPLYGDQNILDALNTFGSKPTQIQSKVQHLPPNSRGDYCENLFEHEHNVQIENKNLTQYPPKKQSENTNPDILNKEPSKEIEVDKEKCEVKNVGEKLLLKQIEFQRHIKAIEKFNEIIRSDDCMVFPDTTTNPFRNIYCETNDKNDMEDDFPNRVLRGERDTIKDDASQSKLYESDENEVAKDLPGKVNKIIRRVEHVYSELEDIQLANIEIPTFQESNQIISVHSDEFLTPFMKHLRNRRHNNNNPSNDGDTEEISSETTTKLDDKIDGTNEGKFIEEHIARLYHLPLIIETAKVKNIRLIENTLEYTEMSRPSCLKKSDDYKVKKKVSFLVVTEEKGNQVDICPHHRIKTVRTSSHQFPPMDEFQTDSSTLREKQVQYDNVETDDEEMVRQEIIKNPENTIGDENISSSKKYDNNEVSNQYNVINKNNLDKKSSDRFTECSETSETRSETLSQSKSNPYILEERQLNVYCDELNGKNPQVVVKNILSTVNNEKTQSKKKSKIILFRELPNISNMLTASKVMLDFNLANKSHWCKNVDINNQFQLSRTKSSEDVKVVTLLKSVYAVVYILMFTALNLEYTCVYN